MHPTKAVKTDMLRIVDPSLPLEAPESFPASPQRGEGRVYYCPSALKSERKVRDGCNVRMRNTLQRIQLAQHVARKLQGGLLDNLKIGCA